MGMTVSLTALDKKTVRTLQRENAIYDKKLKDPTTKGSDLAVLNKLKTKNQAQIAKTLELFRKNKDGKHKTELAGLTPSLMSVQKIYEKIGQNTAEKPDWMPEFLFNLGERPIENGLVVGGAAIALGSFLSTPAGEGAAGLLKEGMKAIFMKSTEAGLVLNWSAIGIAAGGALLAGALIYKKHRKQKEMAASVAFEAEEVANKGTARDEDTLKAARTDKAKFDALVQEAADDPEVYEHLQNVARNSENSVYAKMAQRIIIAAQNEKNKADYALAGQTLQSKFEATPEAVAYMTEQAEVANIEDLYKAKEKAAAEFASIVPAVVTAQKAIDAVFAMSAADLAAKYGSLKTEEAFVAAITNGVSGLSNQAKTAWKKVEKAIALAGKESELAVVAVGYAKDSPEDRAINFINTLEAPLPNIADFIKQAAAEAGAFKLPPVIEKYAKDVYTREIAKIAFTDATTESNNESAKLPKPDQLITEQTMFNTSVETIKSNIAAGKDPLDGINLTSVSEYTQEKIQAYANHVKEKIEEAKKFPLPDVKGMSKEARAFVISIKKEATKFATSAEYIANIQARMTSLSPTEQAKITAAAEVFFKRTHPYETIKDSLETPDFGMGKGDPIPTLTVINKINETNLDNLSITEVQNLRDTLKKNISKIPAAFKSYAKAVIAKLDASVAYKNKSEISITAEVSPSATAKKAEIDLLISSGTATAENIDKLVEGFPKTDPSAEYIANYAKKAKEVVTAQSDFAAVAPAAKHKSAVTFAQIHSQAKDPKAFIAAVGSKEAYLETITDPAMKSVAAAAYDAAVATIAYDSVVAEKSAVVDASGKVTQIDGHAPDANRSFFDNVLGELFKPGSPFYDETGHNMFADLQTAVVTDKKPLKEIAIILKSKYGIDLDTIQKAAKGQEKAAGPEATA